MLSCFRNGWLSSRHCFMSLCWYTLKLLEDIGFLACKPTCAPRTTTHYSLPIIVNLFLIIPPCWCLFFFCPTFCLTFSHPDSALQSAVSPNFLLHLKFLICKQHIIYYGISKQSWSGYFLLLLYSSKPFLMLIDGHLDSGCLLLYFSVPQLKPNTMSWLRQQVKYVVQSNCFKISPFLRLSQLAPSKIIKLWQI